MPMSEAMENVGSHRIDLDLLMINERRKMGWDSMYRNEDRSILFSGDITDAPSPKGATELYYVAKNAHDANILMVNYFNFEEKVDVPFKIVVGSAKDVDFGRDYVLNPNNVVAVASTTMNRQQMILGLSVTTMEENRFYFCESSLGRAMSSSENIHVRNEVKSKRIIFFTGAFPCGLRAYKVCWYVNRFEPRSV